MAMGGVLETTDDSIFVPLLDEPGPSESWADLFGTKG